MFDLLGRNIARYPRRFVVSWIVLILVGAGAALWGFGHGSLFDRMKSSHSMVPDSQSDVVLQRTTESAGTETAVVTVRGIDVEHATEQIAAFRSRLLALPDVTEVRDPINIDEQYRNAIEQNLQKAIDQAITANAGAIEAGVQQALAQAEPQISAAVERAVAEFSAQHPSAPTDEVARQARSQAQAEISAQARTNIENTIAQKARQSAEQQIAAQPNPSAQFQSPQGFVIAITRTVPHSIIQIEQAVTDFTINLQKISPSSDVHMFSTELMHNDMVRQVKTDLVRGETISLPVALLLMVIVFGGLLAAGLPLVGAMASIAIGLGALWAITYITNVETFILNVITIIALALSIDYGLLIVSRYREEITLQCEQRQMDLPTAARSPQCAEIIRQAIIQTVTHAGRTVSFSALTITFSIAGLLAMRAPMLKMIAAGGIIVTILAVTTAVTLVPAVIVLLGPHLVRPSWLARRPRFGRLVTKIGDAANDDGIFSRLAKWVHARPIRILLAVTGIVVLMVVPARGLHMHSNVIEYISTQSDVGQAYTDMQSYRPFATPSASILTEDAAQLPAIQDYVSNYPGVDWVSSPQQLGDGACLIAVSLPANDQVGPEVTQLVNDVRSRFPTVYVGGAAALQLDFADSVTQGAPIALAIIIVSVLTLLFFMTGSIVVPLKALIINALSLFSGVGATLFLFQHGLFGLPQMENLETFVLATAIAFGFGLAMDYEVFLIARIKEFWDNGCDNDTAVEKGLQRSGRIITSAAAIIVAVYIGFVFGDMIPIKQIGVILAAIVVIDATLVRMLLVPATMTLLGRWNWWAPKPLRALYAKFKITH
ncbi:MMPL family transporter [Trueperella sp. LYQ143]|uniref:MMPL family transporter n=1 Tax=Trueperella sp. LYQ143 TaxID=3391059 RepID=UPI0039833012